MISGIIVVLDHKERGFPYDLAVKAWSKVCDEIIIVTHPKEEGIEELFALANSITNINVKVRGVNQPKNFDACRFFGFYFCNTPDWIIYFDADYLISPEDGAKLRKTILSAPPETDIITYKLAYLNRYATHTTFIPALKSFTPPYDGTYGEFPLVVNPRRQNMLAPYEGVSEHNIFVNAETVMSLHPDRWGATFDTKFQNHNPYGFNIIRSDAIIEHVFWCISYKILVWKLSYEYWVTQGYGEAEAKKENTPYLKNYEELDEVRKRFRKSIDD